MALGNFDRCLDNVLEKEGGWSDDPRDPGGATMRGVIQRTYSAWLRLHGLAQTSVRGITEGQLRDIYKTQFWDHVKGDSLPLGVDNCVFDECVNSGAAQAVKDLQQALLRLGFYSGKIDGVVGVQTLAGCKGAEAETLINTICALRLSFLHRLKTFITFGRGWASRVASVKKESLSMLEK